jgi:acetyl esterase/lipase
MRLRKVSLRMVRVAAGLAAPLFGLMCGPFTARPAPPDLEELTVRTLPADTPAAPRGFASTFEVMTAIGLKQVKLISAQLPTPEEVVERRNLEYGQGGSRALQLDLYAPAKLAKPAPALLFIHGGAWSGGSREIYKFYTVAYARKGYVAATMSYRLSGEAPFPAAVEDAKCAVRWLRAHAREYQIDPDRIAALGGSAGGHLALMLGYSPDAPELEGKGGQPGVSSRVQAVVDFYGPYDLTTEFARTNGAVIKFLGGKTYADAPGLFAQASPAHYLKAGAPPTLIFHGAIDDVVPVEQADLLARRLREGAVRL